MEFSLYNTDCMEYMAGIEDNAFDLAIVDPPYGIGINKSGRIGHYGGKKDWDSSPPDAAYFAELFRVSRNQVIWGGNYFALPPTRCFLIWDKEQPEGFSFASCEYAWTSFDAPAKTFYMHGNKKKSGYRIHPVQKPVKLYKWILERYANKGDRILDTHLGSGSSAIAAHYGGCDFVGCEIDADYYNSMLARVHAETAQAAMF